MVIVTSRYLKPLEVIEALREEHRAFLAVYYKQQKLICSGPQNPKVGGAILASVGIDEAREIMKKDPFTVHGAAEYSFIEFTPGSHDPRFACFLK